MDKDKHRVIKEWQEATIQAIDALQAWLESLREWEGCGGEAQPGDFQTALTRLACAGLLGAWEDDWCPLGGGLDNLVEAVTGVAPCPQH